MKVESEGIERILAGKKELVRLFLIAAVLTFSVSGLASLFVSQATVPQWSVVAVFAFLLVLSLTLLGKDWLSTLAFEETADAVVFFDPQPNDVLPVVDYRFAELLHRTLRAVRAESKSIYAEWEKNPLASPSNLPTKHEGGGSSEQNKPTYYAIVKMPIDPQAYPLPKSAHLLEEATTFILVEELSLHLSSFFNDADQDSAVKEYRREDIPAFLLRNRVLNLLSTPIEQRDIFLSAYPDSKTRRKGEIYSLYGSDGAVFSRFDLVLPKGTAIRHSEEGSISIETPRLSLELNAKYAGSNSVISRSFATNYLRVEFEDVIPLKIAVTLRGRVKPLSLLTSSGWQYYRWLDSFRRRR